MRLFSPAQAALLVAMLLWASSFIALKFAFAQTAPEWVIFGRMLVAALCFLPFITRLAPKQINKSDLYWFLLLGLAEPGLYFIFESLALANTSASQAGMITSLLPMLVAIGAAVWLNERVTKLTVVGFALAIGGAALLSVSSESSSSAPHPVFGNLMELMAMVCAAAYTLLLKKLSGRYNTWFITAFQSFFGTLFFLPLALMSTTAPSVTIESMGAILYLGVFITLGAYGLYNWAVQKIPATQASAFTNLIPVFTVILAFILLGERFTQGQVIASLMVISGLALSQISVRPTSEATKVRLDT